MLRLTAVCATLALLLAACASDTTNANASGAGMNGAGGTHRAALPDRGGRWAPGRGAPGSQKALAQTAGDRIFFDTDQSVITPQARETLERQVQWLQQNP